MFLIALFDDQYHVKGILCEDSQFRDRPRQDEIALFEEYEAWELIGTLSERMPDANLGTIQTVQTQVMVMS